MSTTAPILPAGLTTRPLTTAASGALFELIAAQEKHDTGRVDAAVRPDHRGRGIGSRLAAWLQDLGRTRGSSIIGMPVPQGSDGDRLMAALGYHVRWTSWVLSLPEGTTIATRELPVGYTVREADPAEYRALHDVIRTPSSHGPSATARRSRPSLPWWCSARASNPGTPAS